jgi:hypothetical protein
LTENSYKSLIVGLDSGSTLWISGSAPAAGDAVSIRDSATEGEEEEELAADGGGDGGWQCLACTLTNGANSVACGACDTRRGLGAKRVAAAATAAAPAGAVAAGVTERARPGSGRLAEANAKPDQARSRSRSRVDTERRSLTLEAKQLGSGKLEVTFTSSEAVTEVWLYLAQVATEANAKPPGARDL